METLKTKYSKWGWRMTVYFRKTLRDIQIHLEHKDTPQDDIQMNLDEDESIALKDFLMKVFGEKR